MGRKYNPNKTREFRWHSSAPRCPVCGKRTTRSIHKKCEGKPHTFEEWDNRQMEKFRADLAEAKRRLQMPPDEPIESPDDMRQVGQLDLL